MTILGIDPGPNGFAWAVYDAKRNEVTAWGEDGDTPDTDHVAIEDLVALWQRGNPLIETAKTIGKLEMLYPRAILLARKTIAAALTGSARSGDKEINLALGRLVPSFADKRKGLNGHHRAAAAVAYVAAGRVNKRDLLAGKGE